jgi:hypothetical protein
MKQQCKECNSLVEIPEAICNLCGLSCILSSGYPEPYGLINANVHGGYSSTAGNGSGALDDCTSYSFSLCEFCLDWLFSQFKLPVKVSDHLSKIDEETPEIWRPAAKRVVEEDWRRFKDEFFSLYEKHNKARNK